MCLAIPGKIISTNGEGIARSARVDFGGIVREVNLCYLPEAEIDNYVIVHVGFAISIVDQEEAERVFSYLKEMGEFGELAELAAEDPGVKN